MRFCAELRGGLSQRYPAYHSHFRHWSRSDEAGNQGFLPRLVSALVVGPLPFERPAGTPATSRMDALVPRGDGCFAPDRANIKRISATAQTAKNCHSALSSC